MTGHHQVRRWPLFLIAPGCGRRLVGVGRAGRAVRVRHCPAAARDRRRAPCQHGDHAADRGGGVRGVRARRVAGSPRGAARARTFAKRSAIGALALGMAGQVIYHVLAASHAVRAPVPVVVLVSCLPVVTLGLGVSLAHLLREPVSAKPAPGASADPASERESGPDAERHAGQASETPAERVPGRHASTGIRSGQTRRKRAPQARRLSPAEQDAAVLAELEREPAATKSALARVTGLSPRTVGRVLERLTSAVPPAG
jgi:Winged helix-turn-helix DNA-binding